MADLCKCLFMHLGSVTVDETRVPVASGRAFG